MVNTLCSKSWSDVNINLSQRFVQHCCYSRFENYKEFTFDTINSSPKILQRRGSLLQGVKDKDCDACWQSESELATSYRLIHNQWGSIQDVDVKPTFIEIMLDTACDMSCIYCDETSSSKIAREKNVSILPRADYSEMNTTVNWLSTLDHEYVLSFLGGEVTYSRKFIDFLTLLSKNKNIDCSKIICSFCTNGNTKARKLDTVLEKIGNMGFKRVIGVFSNESMGKQSELIRWGLDWDVYKSNVEKYFKSPYISEVGFAMTANIFSIANFTEYVTWIFETAKKYNKKIIITGNVASNEFNCKHAQFKFDKTELLKIVKPNKDLFFKERWFNSFLKYLDFLETTVGAAPYTDKQVDEIIQKLIDQKSDDKLLDLKKYSNK